MRRNRDLRSRLVRLEGEAGERNTPDAIREAARRRVADGAFPDGMRDSLCIAATVLLLEALDEGWNPATDAVPYPAHPDEIDFLGLGGCSVSVPIADPKLHASLIRDAARLDLDLACL